MICDFNVSDYVDYAGLVLHWLLVWGIGYSSGCTLIDVNYRIEVVKVFDIKSEEHVQSKKLQSKLPLD